MSRRILVLAWFIIIGVLSESAAHAQIAFNQCSAQAAGSTGVQYVIPNLGGPPSYNTSVTLPDTIECSQSGNAGTSGNADDGRSSALAGAGSSASSSFLIINNSWVILGSGDGGASAVAAAGPTPGDEAGAVAYSSSGAGFNAITLTGSTYYYNLVYTVNGEQNGTLVSYNFGSGNSITQETPGTYHVSGVMGGDVQFSVGGDVQTREVQALASLPGTSQATTDQQSYSYSLQITMSPQHYSIVEIPPAAGFTAPPLGTAINANGEVTGTFYATSTGDAHLFTYAGGVTTDLGDGDPAANCTDPASGIAGTGINSNGEIAATLCADTKTSQPAIYENGAFVKTGVGPKAVGGVTTAINTKNLVVGSIEWPAITGCPGTTYHAFRYTSSTSKLLDLQPVLKSIGCSSHALSLNDAGEIVGYVLDTNGLSHAFLYSNGSAIDMGALPLCSSSTTPSYSAQANGLNATGEVTGYSQGVCHSPEAFLYSNGTLSDIGNLGGSGGSVGNAINVSGQITGQSYITGDTAQHAFIYSNGWLIDLNSQIPSSDSAMYTLVNGVAINDSGQIVAQGYLNTNESQTVTFLLTPMSAGALRLLPLSTAIDAAGNYVLSLSVANTGDTPVNNVSLSVANLMVNKITTKTSTTLPAAIGSLAPFGSATIALTFPSSAGPSGAAASFKWTLKDTAGLTHGTIAITLP